MNATLENPQTEEQLVNQALVKFPKAKRIAVENVTMGATEMDMAFLINLESDRASYNWNGHTVSAIKWVMGQKARQS